METGDRAVLFNGNNEYLHYQDTWYILGYKPDSYVVSMRGVRCWLLRLNDCWMALAWRGALYMYSVQAAQGLELMLLSLACTVQSHSCNSVCVCVVSVCVCVCVHASGSASAGDLLSGQE